MKLWYTIIFSKGLMLRHYPPQFIKRGTPFCIQTDEIRSYMIINIDEFVSRLKDCEPSMKELLELGVTSSRTMERIRQSYRLKIRDQPIQNPKPDDPICQLISKYDTTKLEIGQVIFADEIIALDGSIKIGDVGGDNLVILEKSGEVVILEFGLNHLLEKCAKSSASFLEAMLTYACNAEKPNTDTENLLEESIHKAGGEDYRTFFEMMLAIW
jgi:hypothetical protein